jgi:hypothetical protein
MRELNRLAVGQHLHEDVARTKNRRRVLAADEREHAPVP